MRNIWKIFTTDIRRISNNVVAVVIIMGLSILPALYAWFNIFSNWDPYGPDSTSNIRVAVTSEDEGYELLGLKLNIGSMVLDGLKSNHQMGWDFVDSREEALEGVRSGRYYAALIVPSDFTGDFVSILDTDLRHPQIQYYENQKKNAIAPKITNKAKTAVQDEINAGLVSEPLPQHSVLSDRGYWLCYPETRANLTTLQQFRDWLLTKAEAASDVLIA